MARFDTTGINDLINDVLLLGDAGKEVGDKMLMAAAEEVKQAWKESAHRNDIKDTGDMINSIGFSRKPKDAQGVRTVDIYPQGKDRKGVRNAEKAFILHYGSSKLKSTHWVDEADNAAAPKVQEAMEKVFDEFLKGKG
jgi:HK97 gp10 family phage protein